MRKPRGFTLIELLIVVGIIAILLMILYGAFARAKVHIKRARCLSNMRQILVALHDYSAANGGKLPPANPWNAQPGSTSPALNEFLIGQGFGVLECPADEGGTPGSETPYFKSPPYGRSYASSYVYQSSGSTEISGIVGSVAWQEEPMGYMSGITESTIRTTLAFDSPGPEAESDPNKRSRDVGQAEIRDAAIPQILGNLSGLQGKSGFNISTSGLVYWHTILATDHEPDPPPPAPQSPRFKWRDQYDPATGQPIAPGLRDPSKWSRPNMWGRNTWNYDYWKRASKKVAVLDGDASLGFTTPASGDAYPKTGQGFWHQYPYVKDHLSAADQGTAARWGVKVHAGFLDGHAEPIVMHKYYTAGNVKYCPVHGSSCQLIDRDDHDYY